jgi:hypothetical protein
MWEYMPNGEAWAQRFLDKGLYGACAERLDRGGGEGVIDSRAGSPRGIAGADPTA